MRVAALLPFFLGLVAAVPLAEGSKGHPTPPNAQLLDIKYGGTGCAPGTVTQAFSEKGDVVTLIYSDFTAESGPGVSIKKNRAFCQLNLRISGEPGFKYAVMKSEYRGTVKLSKGVEASCKADYYFSGFPETVSTETRLKGYIDEDYTKTDVIAFNSRIFSKCGEESLLNIKSTIDINGSNNQKPGLMTVDSNDLKFTQKYHLEWVPCKGKDH